MSKLYKSHRASPVKTGRAGAVVGPSRTRAKRAGRGDSKAGAKPADQAGKEAEAPRPKEIGGPSGPEPTRYGDWEVKGRCIDF